MMIPQQPENAAKWAKIVHFHALPSPTRIAPQPVHIHILGICGTFMGGIAVIAKAAGHHVTGSDSNVYPPMSTQLTTEGIALTAGFGADQAALNPDLWVVGNVVARGNPLIEAILDRGDRYVSGPQWLAENALFGRRVLAVAGTHGKTTTSSMLAWILEDVGRAPGFLIGGVPKNFGASARIGTNTDFVIEADEYDTAFFDKRSKMIHYRPKIAILNNIEFDHADIFPDLAAIEAQFHHFIRTVPGSGKLVVNGADPTIDRVLDRGCWTEVERFGTAAGWSAVGVERGCFEVLDQGKHIGLLRWDLQGNHNRQNALAAIAAARAAGVDPERGDTGTLAFQERPASDGTARYCGRSCHLGRLCPPSDRDCRDPLGHARPGGQRAHSGRARTAFQHHEGRGHEGTPARQSRAR